MKSTQRRNFLKQTSLLAGGLGLSTVAAAEEKPEGDSKKTSARISNSIGVSSYSFWAFRREEFRSMETCLDHTARIGFDGFEVLQKQLVDTSGPALQKIKRHAFLNGIPLMGLSTHQGFLSPDKEERKKNIDHTINCLEQAYQLGIPTMRVNSGRWGTSKDFDELMANKGIEKELEGYTEEDAFEWVIDAYGTLASEAEKRGVIMGLENHWGLGITPEGVTRVVDAVKSPWLQVTLDTGNFLEDPYDRLAQLAPKTVILQAKTYIGGGRWYTLDLDYDRIAKIMHDADFKGWISLEFEGLGDPLPSIKKSLDVLRSSFG